MENTDPYASMDPAVAETLRQTNEVLRDSQALVDEVNAQTGGTANPAISPAVQSTMDMVNQTMQNAASIPELTERAAAGDAEAQAQLDQMTQSAQQQSAMLDAYNVSAEISNDVTQSQYDLMYDNQFHQEIRDSNEVILDAQVAEAAAADALGHSNLGGIETQAEGEESANEISSQEHQSSPTEEATRQEETMQEENQNYGADAIGDPTIGTPEADAGVWDGQQSEDDTCAIRCQEFIIEQFTGQEVDEYALIEEAQANGWYEPGMGTPPEATGNLLELYGIPVQQYENATTFDLANELAQGHKVIIGVDSGELAGGENPILEDIATYTDVDGPDHAVVVSGIDTTDPANPQVIISDPGTGEAAAYYPLDQFLAAWQDSSFFMAATEVPAPSTMPEMANFDYGTGHIPEVAGIPYEDLTATDLTTQLDAMVNAELTQTQDLLDQSEQILDVPPAPVGTPQYDPNVPVNPGDGTFTVEEETEVISEHSNLYDDHPEPQPGQMAPEFYQPPPDLVPDTSLAASEEDETDSDFEDAGE